MNLSSILSGDPAPMPPLASDDKPHVVGFTAEIACNGAPLTEVQAHLDALARASAFRFAGLDPAPGAGTVRARFALSAPNASAGDAQIYALLFALTRVLSWQSLRKEYG
ncbi:MAG: hypothetical protein AcusKO_47490 [Acuticoccus sp.]